LNTTLNTEHHNEPIAAPSWLPEEAECLGAIQPPDHLPILSDDGIRAALAQPLWPDDNTRTVFDIVRAGEPVCFVVSDHTRHTAADRLLPIAIAGLAGKGCSVDDMFVVFASGIHRRPEPHEVARILGENVASQFHGRIFFHDPDEDAGLTAVGTTRRGHTVRLNRRAVEATRLILVGAATYHYHAGFGGGRKSLVPGLADRDTIAQNHGLTLDPETDHMHPSVQPGVLDGNPVAEEMLEAARLHPPDMIINTVLSPAGDLVGVFCGDLDTAHRAACRQVEKACRVDLAERADFVLASAAASNWIQAHKALYNAHRAARQGGRIVLEAHCPEGLGNERFRHWIRTETVEEIYAGLRRAPEVLGQTALSTKMRGKQVVLVTQMPEADAKDLGIETAPDVDSALRRVIAGLKEEGVGRPSYYRMPLARYTVPFVT